MGPSDDLLHAKLKKTQRLIFAQRTDKTENIQECKHSFIHSTYIYRRDILLFKKTHGQPENNMAAAVISMEAISLSLGTNGVFHLISEVGTSEIPVRKFIGNAP